MHNKQNKPPAPLVLARIVALMFVISFITPVLSTTQLVALQGRVLQSGSPAASGSIAVTIWSALSGGSVIYSDNFANAINDGFFDVMLGSSSELNLTYGAFYYLDMSINGEDANWASPQGTTVDRIQFQSRNGQISAGQIQLNAVNASHIQSDAVTTGGILGNAITAAKIAFNSINASHIIDNAITTAKLINDAITSAKIAPASVNSSHIKNGTIDANKLATGSVNSTHILDNTILDADIYSAANISGSKINTTGFCPAPSNYTGYPCYSHFGCSPPGNYTQCLADPNNPANSPSCFNNTAAWRLQSCPFTCPAEMAKIIDTRYGAGVFCVDRWEAHSTAGNTTAGSTRGYMPLVSITRDNAAGNCTNAGKHLCTSQEWLAACNYGSYPFSQIDDYTAGGSVTAPCNTGAGAAASTGTYTYCHTTGWTYDAAGNKVASTDWVYDMVGNVWEWTDAGLTVDNPDASWISGHTSTGDGTGWYTDDDGYWFATTTGRAFFRGGYWTLGAVFGCFALNLNSAPSRVDTNIGFRCCK